MACLYVCACVCSINSQYSSKINQVMIMWKLFISSNVSLKQTLSKLQIETTDSCPMLTDDCLDELPLFKHPASLSVWGSHTPCWTQMWLHLPGEWTMPFSDRSFKNIKRFTIVSLPRTVIVKNVSKYNLRQPESPRYDNKDIAAVKLQGACSQHTKKKHHCFQSLSF